jgi:FKBP-type peptidyl-prolyl cis-trans isomerase FkpA
VPQQPIAKGSMIKLWVGVAAIVLAAGGLAWAGTSKTVAQKGPAESFLSWNKGQRGVVTTASGLQYKVVEKGQGPAPTESDVVAIGYKGTLRDGTVFDENPRATFPVDGLVPGFTEVLKLMPRGAKYKVWIPSALGYGEQSPSPVIPPNSLLVFDIEMMDFKSLAEVQAMQQMQQEQQGAGRAGAQPQ